MRRFLAIAGPTAFTLVIWMVITKIPMPAFILLTLVVISGVLMLLGMAYFEKIADKHQ